jgi:hypothetical protein
MPFGARLFETQEILQPLFGKRSRLIFIECSREYEKFVKHNYASMLMEA